MLSACTVSPVHLVIMGAGRVGVTLAETLDSFGHSVAVIDQSPDAFRRLSDGFSGQRVTGLGFDRDALTQAGIEDAHAFAAVSSGDNSNIIAARVVRETFGVTNVVARIYDAGRAEMYSRLGIPTVATVRWTADQILRRILPVGAVSEFTDASGRVVLAEMDLHPAWIGATVRQVEESSGARIGYLTRWGEGMVPRANVVIAEHDVPHVLCAPSDLNAVQRVLATAPVRGPR